MARLAFTLVSPAPPERAFAPTNPKQIDGWLASAFLSLEHTLGTYAPSGDIYTFRGQILEHQQAAERTLLMQGHAISLPNPNLCRENLGCLPQHAGRWFRALAAPTQGQADQQAQDSLFNTHNKASRLPACTFPRHLFTFLRFLDSLLVPLTAWRQ